MHFSIQVAQPTSGIQRISRLSTQACGGITTICAIVSQADVCFHIEMCAPSCGMFSPPSTIQSSPHSVFASHRFEPAQPRANTYSARNGSQPTSVITAPQTGENRNSCTVKTTEPSHCSGANRRQRATPSRGGREMSLAVTG